MSPGALFDNKKPDHDRASSKEPTVTTSHYNGVQPPAICHLPAGPDGIPSPVEDPEPGTSDSSTASGSVHGDDSECDHDGNCQCDRPRVPVGKPPGHHGPHDHQRQHGHPGHHDHHDHHDRHGHPYHGHHGHHHPHLPKPPKNIPRAKTMRTFECEWPNKDAPAVRLDEFLPYPKELPDVISWADAFIHRIAYMTEEQSNSNRCALEDLKKEIEHYRSLVEKERIIVVEREKEISTLKASLTSKNEVIEKLKITINKKDIVIKEKNKTIETKNKTIKEMEETITEKESIIEERESTIKEKETIIEEKEATIVEKEHTITEREQTIKKRDATIKDKETTIKKKEQTIREKEATIKEKDRTIKEKEKSTTRKERDVFEHEEHSSEKTALTTIRTLRAEVKRLKKLLEITQIDLAQSFKKKESEIQIWVTHCESLEAQLTVRSGHLEFGAGRHGFEWAHMHTESLLRQEIEYLTRRLEEQKAFSAKLAKNAAYVREEYQKRYSEVITKIVTTTDITDSTDFADIEMSDIMGFMDIPDVTAEVEAHPGKVIY